MSDAVAPPASRNAHCPCGSGRRYKDCHGALMGEHGALPPLSLLDRALAAQKTGSFDEARALYERVLARDPRNFDALHMLGVVHFQRNDFARAHELIAAALALRPDVAMARRNLRLARDALRRLERAAEYPGWIALREAVQDARRKDLRAAVCARTDAPVLSLLMPTWNAPPRWLSACLDSVLAQSYSHWELCVADDASTAQPALDMLAHYAARDARICVVHRPSNGHISAASNSALAIATGAYVALVDHDDVLAPHALAEVALAVIGDGALDIVYSDEDKIDETGVRFEPYFKPDWNPALLRSQNCISHLGVYRTALLREIGGFREGTEGAQDWDVTLRCADRSDPRRIQHIPQVLYHWRAIAGSTARSMKSKDYAAIAQERVLDEDAARHGRKVTLTRVAYGAFLQADPTIAELPSTTLVVLQTDSSSHQEDVVAQWRKQAAGRCNIAAVRVQADRNPSGDFDAAPLCIGTDGARAINAAVEGSSTEVIVFVMDRLKPLAANWLTLFVAHALQPGVGCVGGSIQDAVRLSAMAGYLLDAAAIAVSPYVGEPEEHVSIGGRNRIVQNLSALCLRTLAVRRAVWREAGGLDVAHLVVRFHDVDLCLRLGELGYRHVWHPGVRFAAAQPLPVTSVPPADDADATYMRDRWGSLLARDPAYNPNLARSPRLFDFASIGQ